MQGEEIKFEIEYFRDKTYFIEAAKELFEYDPVLRRLIKSINILLSFCFVIYGLCMLVLMRLGESITEEDIKFLIENFLCRVIWIPLMLKVAGRTYYLKGKLKKIDGTVKILFYDDELVIRYINTGKESYYKKRRVKTTTKTALYYIIGMGLIHIAIPLDSVKKEDYDKLVEWGKSI